MRRHHLRARSRMALVEDTQISGDNRKRGLRCSGKVEPRACTEHRSPTHFSSSNSRCLARACPRAMVGECNENCERDFMSASALVQRKTTTHKMLALALSWQLFCDDELKCLYDPTWLLVVSFICPISVIVYLPSFRSGCPFCALFLLSPVSS